MIDFISSHNMHLYNINNLNTLERNCRWRFIIYFTIGIINISINIDIILYIFTTKL
jgi:hypothetical protein